MRTRAMAVAGLLLLLGAVTGGSLFSGSQRRAPDSGGASRSVTSLAHGDQEGAPADDPAEAADERTSAAEKPLLASAPPLLGERALGRLGGGPVPGSDAERRVEARSARARVLNDRLERRVAELRERLARATGAERAELERDLSILERNLAQRKHLVRTPRRASSREAAPSPASSGAR